jgi:raffinose/stachyose/melibiose transport system substrate-binding protein
VTGLPGKAGDPQRLAADHELRRRRKRTVRNAVGLALLVLASGWAAAMVAWRTFGPQSELGEEKVIRFAHWQLEGGVVDALDDAAQEYMELHPNVVVKQIPVPERGYEQWVKTQLIGRTAPDLIELRTWTWTDLIARYFTPLDEVVERPNPYNADTELEGVPWKQTYIDNMRGGYVSKIQGQYGMPLSVFTVRCYANADLVAKATGWSKPEVRRVLTGEDEPLTLGRLFEICRAIQDYARQRGRGGYVVPIAGSRYTADMFRLKYWDMATWGLRETVDENLNGATSDAERLEAILTGEVDLRTDRHVRTAHELLYELGRQFNPGFLSTKRDERVLLFTRGSAAMIATGTWDAGTIFQYVDGDFDIVVFDFPTAGADEKYGDIVRHRLSEAGTTTGFSFGLTKYSRHPDIAVDFMQFLTSRTPPPSQAATRLQRRTVDNEWLNRRFRWFPAIRGAGTDRVLRAFRPKLDGVYGGIMKIHLSGDTQLRYEGAFQRFIGTDPPEGVPYDVFFERHYSAFIGDYAETYRQYALSDFQTAWENAYQSIFQTEAALAQMRARSVRHQRRTGRAEHDLRRSLVSSLLGQVRKAQQRHVDRRTVDRVRRQLEAAGE